MKNKLMCFLLMCSLEIFGQVTILSGDFGAPPLPIDTISDVTNGRIETKRLYIAEGNDFNKNNRFFLDDNELKYVDVEKYNVNSENTIFLDNHSKPTEVVFTNNNQKITLNKKVDYFTTYMPFIIGDVDSIPNYQTDYDFTIELVYSGRKVESILVHFETVSKKSFDLASIWYNSLSHKERLEYNIDMEDKESLLALWIDVTFMNRKSKDLPESNYCKKLIKNQKFSFYYTNNINYISPEENKW